MEEGRTERGKDGRVEEWKDGRVGKREEWKGKEWKGGRVADAAGGVLNRATHVGLSEARPEGGMTWASR